MIIRSELAALRGDDAPQRQAQAEVRAVLQAWQEQGQGQQLNDELARLDRGVGIADLPVLADLFDPGCDAAAVLVGSLIDRFVRQLDAEPLTQTPLRYLIDDAVASVVVGRQGGSLLILQAIDGVRLARRPRPVSVCFPPAETWERVITGRGQALRARIATHRPDRADLDLSEVTLTAGDVAHRLGMNETQVIHSAAENLVVLRLQRRIADGQVTREHRLNDGLLLHQSAGTARDSRLELTAALLGRMGRTDAVPLLVAMVEETGSQSVRWQALRECLGLDSAAGFAALSRVAQSTGDPLARPAGALRAQLLETYPQLAGVIE
ncbi:MAG: hypothetical protein J0M19_15565 [Sphingomonadales bacterium]|nr:hypothetical protein [Sphingomonadales bacterium]